MSAISASTIDDIHKANDANGNFQPGQAYQYNVVPSNASGVEQPASILRQQHAWDPQFHGSVHTATIAVCIVLVIFVVILGTFGNGLVILSSLQCRKRRSNFDVFIYNLAVVDFIICSCLSPTFLYLLFSDPPSPRGFCGVYLFVCTACGLQSLLTLVAIAAYRQSRIRGLRRSLTSTKTTLILISTYAICFASAIGGTLQVSLSWESQNSNCQNIINSSHPFTNNVILYFISPIVIISFILITTSYIIIAKAVKLQSALRTKSILPSIKSPTLYRPLPPTGNSKDYTVTQDMHQIAPESILTYQKSQKSSRLRHCTCCSCSAAIDKENKAVSMCYVVIVIIALCWTPFIISHFVELITGESIIIYQVKLCGIALVFLNSALDPYMYAQNNTRMKQRYAQIFWDLLRCECRAPPKPKFRTSSPGFLLPRTSPNPPLYAEEGFLPFLQPKYKTPALVLGQYPRIEVENTKLNYNSNLVQHPHQRNCYQNKIAIKGASHNNLLEPPKTHTMVSGRKHHRHGNPQPAVKILVQQTCCKGNSPDDQSLMDSSFPH